MPGEDALAMAALHLLGKGATAADLAVRFGTLGAVVARQREAELLERLVDEKYFEFLQNRENKIVLEKALSALKPELRDVVHMTYFEDLSQTEIAQRLGISQMQVSRRLRKALDQLSKSLAPERENRN